MPRTTTTLLMALFGLAFLALTTGPVLAQARPPGMPEPEADTFPLGGIAAQGDVGPHGPRGNETILVTAVREGGPAERGGLVIGDVIYGLKGKAFKKEGEAIVDELCLAIEKAEAKKVAEGRDPAVVVLSVVGSDGKKTKKSIPVESLGKFHATDPTKCEKTPVVLERALEFLKQQQHEDGHFAAQKKNENHAVVTAALGGLAWLGAAPEIRDRYDDNVKAAARYVVKNAGAESGPKPKSDANWNQTHWALAYGAVFLGEYLARHQDEEAKQKLAEMVKLLADQQEATGGWAHGPGGPNALDYLELQIMSNFALAGMGMARLCDVPIDEGKMLKGVEYVKQCTQGGGVAYSTRSGQLGSGDPGRTAGAYWSFRLLGRKGKVVGAMAKYYERGLKDLPEGHACPTMHILAGAMASGMIGKKSYKKYWKAYRPFIMASRDHDGAFNYRPNHESRQMKHHADRSWGTTFCTAQYAIALQCGQGRYARLDVGESAR